MTAEPLPPTKLAALASAAGASSSQSPWAGWRPAVAAPAASASAASASAASAQAPSAWFPPPPPPPRDARARSFYSTGRSWSSQGWTEMEWEQWKTEERKRERTRLHRLGLQAPSLLPLRHGDMDCQLTCLAAAAAATLVADQIAGRAKTRAVPRWLTICDVIPMWCDSLSSCGLSRLTEQFLGCYVFLATGRCFFSLPVLWQGPRTLPPVRGKGLHCGPAGGGGGTLRAGLVRQVLHACRRLLLPFVSSHFGHRHRPLRSARPLRPAAALAWGMAASAFSLPGAWPLRPFLCPGAGFFMIRRLMCRQRWGRTSARHLHAWQ
jgi:hypothetical protein